jgi:hypothetical protein
LKNKKDQESKDFCLRLDEAHKVINNYYFKTDMSPLYAAALILNPANRTRYIKQHWPRKYIKLTLRTVKQLWESYRDDLIKEPTSIPLFSYDNPKEPKELDEFD